MSFLGWIVQTNEIGLGNLQVCSRLGEGGGLSGASRSLGISYSTAHRHLQTIEKDIGAPIFKRMLTGYELTSLGVLLADSGRRMEAEVLGVERQLAGSDQQLTGTIRVSTSELLGLCVIPGLISEFQNSHPGIFIELSVADRLTDLHRREADVVIRGSSNPPGDLIGKRIGPIPYAAYAHQRLFLTHGSNLEDYEWLILEAKENTFFIRWTKELVPDVKPRLAVDSGACLCSLLACGHGSAILPCFVGDESLELVRITPPQVDPALDLWILSHAELRRNARVMAFRRFMQKRLGSSVICAPPGFIPQGEGSGPT